MEQGRGTDGRGRTQGCKATRHAEAGTQCPSHAPRGSQAAPDGPAKSLLLAAHQAVHAATQIFQNPSNPEGRVLLGHRTCRHAVCKAPGRPGSFQKTVSDLTQGLSLARIIQQSRPGPRGWSLSMS